MGAAAAGVVFWPNPSTSLMRFGLKDKRTVVAAAADRLFRSHPFTCFNDSAKLFGRRLR